MMEHAAKVINEKYGRKVVTLTLKDSYYNMVEKLADHMELVENAKRACEQAGMKPFIEAVRGGTDGCRLSYMGRPRRTSAPAASLSTARMSTSRQRAWIAARRWSSF